jgi:hypothetical protein
MKYIISITLLIPFLLNAQSDTLISFSDVISIDSTAKEHLFQRARQWYNRTFVSSKDVLQIADKQTGELSGKGIIKSYYDYKIFGNEKPYECYYRFSLEIKVKDNRYKYMFSNFIVEETLTPGLGMPFPLTSSDKSPKSFPMISQKKVDAMYVSMKKHLTEKVAVLIMTLKTEMAKKNEDDF